MVNPPWLVASYQDWVRKYRPAKLRFLEYWRSKHHGGWIRSVDRDIKNTDNFYARRGLNG